eukprot:scaffold2404_cov398-Prasinococcus_capsulatus_cf.AAC.13
MQWCTTPRPRLAAPRERPPCGMVSPCYSCRCLTRLARGQRVMRPADQPGRGHGGDRECRARSQRHPRLRYRRRASWPLTSAAARRPLVV